MKKRWLGSLFLLSSLFLTACSGQTADTQQDSWMRYEEEKSITIGFDKTFVPMGFEETNGDYVGFDIDLATAVFDQYGVKIDWQPIDWDLKETELNNGTIDLIWNGYSATDERKEKVLFSHTYMANEQVLVVKDSSGIESLTGMAGKRLGAQAGSSGYGSFEKEPAVLKDLVKDQTATQYATFNEALIDLQTDRIDGLLIDRVYANYYLQEEGLLDSYRLLETGYASESFAVGARKADVTLVERINQALKTLYKDGSFQEISQKWFGEDVASTDIAS